MGGILRVGALTRVWPIALAKRRNATTGVPSPGLAGAPHAVLPQPSRLRDRSRSDQPTFSVERACQPVG